MSKNKSDNAFCTDFAKREYRQQITQQESDLSAWGAVAIVFGVAVFVTWAVCQTGALS